MIELSEAITLALQLNTEIAGRTVALEKGRHISISLRGFIRKALSITTV